MGKKVPIAIAEGDGIGPEIMSATLEIMNAAGAQIDPQFVEIGEKVYLRGFSSGMEESTWDTIRNTKAFLKGPITTPQGSGFKSLNVTIRTTLGLYANIRPCVAYAPFVNTKHPKMDVVVIRENEEDLYMGIEYRQTPNIYHALKVISQPGSEKIVRYAFEYARMHQRKKVTCFTKDNILKLSDGEFHRVFAQVAKEYPDIENEHWIVDIGAAKLADTPEVFDVIVLPNLYGDILSDVAAQIAGSVGLAGSANVGIHGAMFEAIHGSAPRRAGQNSANPSGLLLAGVMLLSHIGQSEVGALIHNAWLYTLEQGIHTYDIFKEGVSKEKVGTQEFAKAVIAHLGKKPKILSAVKSNAPLSRLSSYYGSNQENVKKMLVGIDIFIESFENLESVRKLMQSVEEGGLTLTMMANRGVQVWPNVKKETECLESWRCRFLFKDSKRTPSHKQLAALLDRLASRHVDFTHTENLYTFDGKSGYTLSQEEQ